MKTFFLFSFNQRFNCKTNVFFVCALIVLCILSLPSLAQQTTLPITAREAYAAGLTSAGNDISDPQMTAITAVKADNVSIVGSTRFYMENGTSNLWIVAFRSAVNNELRMYGVFKSVLDSKIYAIQTTDTNNVPTIAVEGMWKNSDSIPKYLMRNNLYSLYRAQFPDSSAATIGCVNEQSLDANNEGNPFPVNATIWIGVFPTPTSTLICGFEAVAGGETFCNAIPTSVTESTDGARPQLYPNPATDMLIVRLPESSQGAIENAYLFDLQGNAVVNASAYPRYENNRMMIIPVRQLPQGVYSVRLMTNTTSFTSTFLIHR